MAGASDGGEHVGDLAGFVFMAGIEQPDLASIKRPPAGPAQAAFRPPDPAGARPPRRLSPGARRPAPA
ncbi:MAG: molecular chaperone DnaJ, partial [Actinomycetota bacterium]|nr:molecular chaperone DnaJ [Actinomycetota bacterium]